MMVADWEEVGWAEAAVVAEAGGWAVVGWAEAGWAAAANLPPRGWC